MVGQECEITRTDLMAMGFDKKLVYSLPATNISKQGTLEKDARHDKSDEIDDRPFDKSQEKVLVREAYIRVDFDGDGYAELRQVFTANGKVLSNDEVDRQPFHVICPQPLPHKHFGRSTAEKVMDVQKVTTTLLRQ